MPAWRLADRTLDLDAPGAVIGAGIVNVTVDSMYAGARSGTAEQAVSDGVVLAGLGFEMLDVGAVAARSGPPVAPEAEIERLIPAIAGLAAQAGAPVSADTFVPAVASAAVAAGAVAVNDIGGGRDEMLEAVGAAGCGYVLMHIEGPPRVDRPAPRYDDVVDRLKAFFAERIERAVALGVAEEAIAIDPGLDFDLTVADDVEVLRRLDELHALGRPLYVSLSRKDFVGALLAGSWEGRLGADARGNGTTALAALAAAKGAQVHRLHDVEALDAIRVAARIAN
ncbi:MAG TPA: dihydropteroate synthase [Solirubrobacterales bacterium]|nr:dihydropteroate synthase [Solirubrobacterales bacterium]